MPYKIVNIEAKMKIGVVTPMIYGREKNRKMSYGEILKCLAMRAVIDEVMPDGSTVRLNMKNYHHDFVGDWKKQHETKAVNTDEQKKIKYQPPQLEVKDNNKKNKGKNNIPTNSTETVEEVPEAPTSVEEVKDPVVETKDKESADTPADEPEHKASGFNRDKRK